MTDIRYDGRVIAVTGGGRGIGAAYARMLAARGASVVINEIDKDVGNALVREITEASGRAVSNNFDVMDPASARQIIEQAISEFGRIDGLICNAGFLRDRSFVKMTLQEFEDIVRVHLLGAVYPIHAAWPIMREQNFGRIVLTTSASALWGNFGQANYDAAKLGLVGLMKALKLESATHDIKINTIAPLAGTRLSEGILSKDDAAILHPDQIAGLVTYLCAEANQVSGQIFELGGGFISRVEIARSAGVVGDFSNPDAVSSSLDRILAQPTESKFTEGLQSIDQMMSALKTNPN